jgi:hypothetical protein
MDEGAICTPETMIQSWPLFFVETGNMITQVAKPLLVRLIFRDEVLENQFR